MQVLYWQFIVVGSTAVLYILGSRLLGISAAIVWSIWTLIKLRYTPLIMIQISSAWGTFFLVNFIINQSKKIEKLNDLIKDFNNDEKKAIIEADKEGKITPLIDSNHYTFMLNQINNAKSSILILSGWISDRVIDNDFIEAIEKALRREVHIFISNFRLGFCM